MPLIHIQASTSQFYFVLYQLAAKLSQKFFEVKFLAQLHRGQLDESQGLLHMVAGGISGIQGGT